MHELRERVFVSSTVYDLIDLRAELAEYLRDLGVEPLLAEHPEFATKSDASAIELCLRRVDDADVVFVILDARYGERLSSHGGISATELEYNHARARGMQPHVFIRDRVLADKALWEKSREWKKEEQRLVREEDAKPLFDWIHRLQHQDPKPFLSQFRDSLDLKRRVGKFLERQAERAVISSGLRDGSIPIIHLGFAPGVKDPQGMDCKIFHTGEDAILDVCITTNEDGAFKNIDMLSPGQHDIPIARPKGADRFEFTIAASVEFTTLRGQRIKQSWNFCRRNGAGRAVLENVRLLSFQQFTLGEPPAP